MKKAIVFDNSGTLVKRYRAIKNISSGNIFTDVNSMDIIDQNDSLSLVVLQFNTNKLVNLPSDTLISDVIKNFNVDFDVSFTNGVNITKEEVREVIENDKIATVKDITDAFPILREKIPNFELCNGSALIVDVDKASIDYTITSAGVLFPNVLDTIEKLKSLGIDIYIASGDRKGAIDKLADILGTDRDKAYGSVSPMGKSRVVKNLQKKGYKVIMVGDGINDILAFNQADISVLTTEQASEVSSKMYDKSDYIIDEISKLLSIDFF